MKNIDDLNKLYIIFNKILALFFFILSIPLIILIVVLIKLTSKGQTMFKQVRVGHKLRRFTFYKFRTMIKGADKFKEKYNSLNYADGPVFKIRNDPRFTKIGKFLSETHLDELPQLINVVKGDMFLVGFRPPTLDEVKKYRASQMDRFEGYPGITSYWAVNGGHKNFTFDNWIKSDINYENKRGYLSDIKIILKTIILCINDFFYRKK